MLELLSHVFAAVCGQNPEHTWGPGGLFLPFCQRCTGLYIGAVFAAFLHAYYRPALTGRFLEVHGVFLLVMVPFGYHWLPQEALLRSSTGVLFGCSLVTYLWLAIAGRRGNKVVPKANATRIYAAIVGSVLGFLPLLAARGGTAAAVALSFLGCCGAMILLVLICANIGLGAAALARLILHLKERATI